MLFHELPSHTRSLLLPEPGLSTHARDPGAGSVSESGRFASAAREGNPTARLLMPTMPRSVITILGRSTTTGGTW